MSGGQKLKYDKEDQVRLTVGQVALYLDSPPNYVRFLIEHGKVEARLEGNTIICGWDAFPSYKEKRDRERPKIFAPPAPPIPPSPLQEKMLLNLPQAQSLTGLSGSLLLEAIDGKKLRSQLIEEEVRIRPKDLKKFVDGLFK